MTVSDVTEQLARQVCADRGFDYVRPVGVGAFKHTFHVRGPEGEVALKLVIGDIDSVRIAREIGALQACSHRNICRLYSVGAIAHGDREIAYLIEEFLEGGTLTACLATQRHLSIPEVGLLASALSEAIAHFAERNIVHRDIKPDNIMFRGDGVPVVVDLGIVRQLDASSLTRTWLMQGPGTPLYAAPEQLMNEKHLIDWRSDQFSLGITLSIAFLGVHPYAEGASFERAVERMARRDRPTELFYDLVQSADVPVLKKMVEPWPIRRFARPGELVEAWRDWERTR